MKKPSIFLEYSNELLDYRYLKFFLKSAEKSATLLVVSASGSAFFFFTGERERERVRFFAKEREREPVCEIKQRANALADTLRSVPNKRAGPNKCAGWNF